MKQAAARERPLQNERAWLAAMVVTLCCKVAGACARQECTWRRVRKGCDVCGVMAHHSLGSPGAHPAAKPRLTVACYGRIWKHNFAKSCS
jgi:hypothetical protein